MPSYAILGGGLSARAALDDLLARGASDITVYLQERELAAFRRRYPMVRTTDDWSRIPEEILVRSPGIRPDLPPIARALAAGARLTGEIEWVCARSAAPILAVTGSDGKTTTATLAAKLLENMGYRVWLGGNIGTSLLPHMGEIRAQDRVVLELSSFQLMTFSPSLAAAAVTNLTENHLDWHRDMAEYRAAKRRILPNAARRVENAAAPIASELPSLRFSATIEGAAYHLSDGMLMHGEEPLAPLSCLYRPSLLLTEDLLCAAALTGAPGEHVMRVAADFRGVAHRCAYLGCYAGVHCYDASIDTTPARTAATLSTFSAPVTVLCGGRNKNLPLDPLADALCRCAAQVVFFGEAGEAMRDALCTAGKKVPPHRYVRNFTEAVSMALSTTPSGGTLVLSPAATSFDAFRSYVERAEAYQRILLRLSGGIS